MGRNYPRVKRIAVQQKAARKRNRERAAPRKVFMRGKTSGQKTSDEPAQNEGSSGLRKDVKAEAEEEGEIEHVVCGGYTIDPPGPAHRASTPGGPFLKVDMGKQCGRGGGLGK
jgi:hypothetical protein